MTARLRSGAFFASGALVLGGLLASTSAQMGAPPAPLGLLALGVVVLAAVLLGVRSDDAPSSRGTRLALLLLFVCLGAVAAQDFLRPGVARGHDIHHHAWAYWSLWRSVLDGDLYPRWNPYLALGIPLLQFYCPLGYLAGWPAQLFGASPLQAMAFVFVLFQAVGAGAAYASVRWLGGSRAGGLVAALALALAPYHLLDQNFRVALGETLALAWLVPTFAAGWKLARGERGAAPWVLGAGLGLLLLTHVLTLIMACAGLVLLVGLSCWARPAGRRPLVPSLGGFVLVGVLTMGATAAWWLPVVVEQEHTSVSRLSRPGQAISRYAVTLDEPLSRRLWSRYGVRRSLNKLWKLRAAVENEPSDRAERALAAEQHRRRGMTMYFGWGLALLLLLALTCPRGEPEGQSRRARCIAIAGLVLLALSIYPFARLLDGVPLLGRIMYPWRLYAPATALVALGGGLAFDAWLRPGSRVRSAGLLMLLGLLAVDAAPFLGAAVRYPGVQGDELHVFEGGEAVDAQVPRDRFVRIEDAPLPPADYDWQLAKSRWVFSEYMAAPLRKDYGKLSKPPSAEKSGFYGASLRFSRTSARRQVLEPQPMLEFREAGGSWRGLDPGSWHLEPERIEVELPPGLVDGEVRYKGAWFPGWEVRLDDGAWQPTRPPASHLLQAGAPEGTRRVTFRYSFWRPRDRPVGLAISLVTLALLGVLGRRRPWLRE